MLGSVKSGDGKRLLFFETSGDPKGHPVFLLHGTPGSRVGPRPRAIDLYKLGIRLISYDRPGYGESQRLKDRAVCHAAADVEAIAEHLNLGPFSVLGRSGGGPHALACAALLPDSVASAAALVSLAPHNADDLDWYDGMAQSNIDAYKAASAALEDGSAACLDRLKANLASNADAIRDNPASLLSWLTPEMPAADRVVVGHGGIRNLLLANYRTSAVRSSFGWLDDVLSFRQNWGFEPGKIVEVPTMLWHGEDDTFSPVGHFRWLADRIPSATPVLKREAAHFAALPAVPEILAWLRDRARDRFGAVV
ncbi:alpha/beta fold hydrolase [Streptomyces chartreusis]|uniref:alpha/beta fold hydrolase n=1 Tax=Streptomyces TaxID=1883 RepID=UPI002E804C30|nr:alpha/beta fold hydrolase [Streptomyces chartreusis]WSZ70014.1 alpha/beta hydrolase [Streptomyces chartreusis]WTA27001.1 alpha/beta hydrolase [Streptomyces chartreusis]WUB17645.1 alpha/beta hydrolase [Streptomyces chartreusis]